MKESVRCDFQFNTLDSPELTAMLDEARRFIWSMYTRACEPYWLTLLGRSGIGKTHLAMKTQSWYNRVGRFYKDKYHGVVMQHDGMYADWRSVVDLLREGRHDMTSTLYEAWFAVIDDIGSEYDPSGFAADRLSHVLNKRVGKWTIITGNLDVRQISERIDPRVASRLLRGGNTVVSVKDCKDYSLTSNK